MTPTSSIAPVRRVLLARDLALLLTLLSFFVGMVVWQLPFAEHPLEETIHPPRLTHVRGVPVSHQRWAHATALIAIAASGAAGILLLQRRRAWLTSQGAQTVVRELRTLRRGSIALGLLGITAIILDGAPAWRKLSEGSVLAFVFAVLVLAVLSYRLPLYRFRWLLVVLGAGFALYVLVTPIRSPLNLSHWTQLHVPEFDWHYGVLVGDGDRLAAGLHLFDEVRPHYGYLMPTLLGLAERQWGILSYGGHVRMIQVFQIVYLLVAAAAFWMWGPRRGVRWFLLAVLIVVPLFPTTHWVWTPNATGWRFLGVPVGLLLLLLLGRMPLPRAAFWLGTVSGLLLLHNLENGVAMTFGYGMFLVSRTYRPKLSAVAGLAMRGGAGVLCTIALFVIGFRLGFGYWPLPKDPRLLFLTLQRIDTNFAGILFKLDFSALLIFLHSSYVVIYSIMIWWRRELGWRTSVRLAVASFILLWFAYYAYRPGGRLEFLVPYAFLLASFFDYRSWSAALGKAAPLKLSYRSIVPLALLGPMFVAAIQGSIDLAQAATKAPDPDHVEVSGVLMPGIVGRYVLEKADYLRSLDPKESLMYFTGYSYQLPLLTGVYSTPPYHDGMGDVITKRDFTRYLDDIRARAPQRILFDDPTRMLDGGDYRREHYYLMRTALLGMYKIAGASHGWVILERNLP